MKRILVRNLEKDKVSRELRKFYDTYLVHRDRQFKIKKLIDFGEKHLQWLYDNGYFRKEEMSLIKNKIKENK